MNGAEEHEFAVPETVELLRLYRDASDVEGRPEEDARLTAVARYVTDLYPQVRGEVVLDLLVYIEVLRHDLWEATIGHLDPGGLGFFDP